MTSREKDRTCGDCDAKPGELHQDGCDVERCCLCGGQSISCPCVYEINGMDPSTLEFEHPSIFVEGPTEEMHWKRVEEEDKYGGRLPWTGEWPGVDACREFGLYCFWADLETGEPKDEDFGRPGKYVPCSVDHPKATEDLNRLPRVAHWDKVQRKWVRNK
jgi:hypothetical protein